jgi:hypothetical protein
MLRAETEPEAASDHNLYQYRRNLRQPFEEEERCGEQYWVARDFESRINATKVQKWYRGSDGQEKDIEQHDSDNTYGALTLG